ncbi:universal stress protein [Virgisporangium aliadipatigenens]|uniref:Universal stress protein n=1 Tax=Virgisporangium aliadipatigenens TaxID=741659 RepID=A0A8J4DRX2_9ACTN|nr:universal stress protein [Virgisporangium aliadipatigenens]GIJ48129.1 universal stress protein [Virgisporangium aliadipatigenens]
MAETEIVVGVDGSVPSLSALRLAAAEAERHRSRLRVITAYGRDPRTAREVRQHYTGVVSDALREIRIIAPGVSVAGQAVEGDPTHVLLRAARGARMLVVGSRGGGGFRDLLLGSVSQRVATHATVPVLVVRGGPNTVGRKVVVGVDRSAGSSLVLDAAFEEAAARGVALHAVRAYGFPVPPIPAAITPLPYDPPVVRRHECEGLRETLAPWREKFPEVAILSTVSQAGPARILMELSAGAGVVVVGSHGHSAVVGTLLGSVGLQLLHHAACPVLIAR